MSTMKSPEFFITQIRTLRSSVELNRNVHYQICNSLNSIREAVRETFPEFEESIQRFTTPVESSNGEPPAPGDPRVALLLCDQLLNMLLTKAVVKNTTTMLINRITPESRTVFVVHGHDEVNLLRLRALLRDKFGLNPVILMDEPSSGQTIIEKFERAATEAAFCLVLMTPDDQVSSRQGEATQARPNVIFELGWFYGRLGRARVCILAKRGTSVHSDLSGIVRIEFIENVEEAAHNLEKELRQAGLV
jgi:predicted nucleotide-binding protein